MPLDPKQVALAKEIRDKFFTKTHVEAEARSTWKNTLRQYVGSSGEVLWQGILRIAAGEAWTPKLPDGREGPPQIPDGSVRLQAYIYLANALFGKPASQEKITEAEKAAIESADLHALSDAELLEAVRKTLQHQEKGTEEAQLSPGKPDGK